MRRNPVKNNLKERNKEKYSWEARKEE